MDIEATQPRIFYNRFGQNLSERRNRDHVRMELLQQLHKRRIFYFLRLINVQTEFLSQNLDRRGNFFQPSSFRAVGLGDNTGNRIALFMQEAQSRKSECGRAHKKNARVGHRENILYFFNVNTYTKSSGLLFLSAHGGMAQLQISIYVVFEILVS
ncbi:MAG: hypothetical protein BWX55_00855 [Deltaproteobacteria bacterium ADurb.Bin022]|nr:MAG: hypothetical protein BWX55_00855 [Deltaproteobacteria bacterium ADurb.Bin022]